MTFAGKTRLIPALAFAGAFLFACAACGPSRSSVDFTGSGGKRVALRALSREARRGRLELPSSTAWFSFNAEKAGIPATATVRGGRGAIEVTIVREGERSDSERSDGGQTPVDPAPFVKFSLALVRVEDIAPDRALSSDVGARDLSTIVTDSPVVRISMTIPDSGDFAHVTGFAVSASGNAEGRYRIESAAIVPSASGWEKGSGSFRAAFGPSGGSIDSREAVSAPVALYPLSVARITFAASDPGSIDEQNRVVFSVGGRTVGFRASPVPCRAYLPASLALSPAASAEPVIARAVSGASSVRGFFVERNVPYALTTTVASMGASMGAGGKPGAGGALAVAPAVAHSFAPILADPHMIIEWPQEAWRRAEYELFAWDRFPSVLVFDTADYAVQDRLFKRLAFFAEKRGFRGTLADDAALSGLHAYNAHDYRADTLAAFFDLARSSSFPLGAEELALRDVLEGEGVIRKDGESYVAGAGAVLSISRESVSYLRYLFMAHEGYHGIYFTDPDYRAEVSSVYASMDSRAIEFLESYFTIVDSLGYDRADRYLMENEFMGYLMQQGEANVAKYFTGTITERFLRYGGDPALADYIADTDASEFTRAASELGAYAFSRWGLAGGRVGLYFFD